MPNIDIMYLHKKKSTKTGSSHLFKVPDCGIRICQK